MKVLTIAPHYHTFVKGSVESISKHLDVVTVIAHHNYLSELARYLPFPYFRHVEKFSKSRLVDLTGRPKNVKVHIVSMLYLIPDGRNPNLGGKLARKLEKFIQENKIEFDLIHAHFTWPSGYAAARLSKEFNVPLVITAHGYDVYDLPFRSREWFRKVKFALDSADHVITVSKSNFVILVEKLGIAENKISIIPNGFDSNLFRPMDKALARKQLNLPQDKKVVLNVANLVPIKGHKYLIEAIKNVVKGREDIMLIIVGDGPLRKDLEKQINKLNLESYVKLVGAKPHHEIPLWINAADLFVLPSLSEGNPTVMFEALGVGLPFVGATVGGIPEIITSEDYGLLCPPKDPHCLAEKILIALDKEWDRDKIRKYAEQFTWENIARQTFKVYKQILKRRNLHER
ncbi:glycosyltransferase family 4 protein [Thermococcus sp. M36]|uniref:glycosyltransferase family 4 protein n=1 Tax=Thermococcus sp. M36 TaxID=1638261 RepID=UPI00143C6753|nr:glycosyltransferase family 4 protein [Thermococcus sp. M36]NJE05720.1 glycosyltransferase family 4 protein [Thermococcus sp. M36]